MSNANENMIVRHQHGKVGNQVVFRVKDGQSIMGNIPKKRTKPLTPAQQQIQFRFKDAASWAKSIMGDPIQKAAYQSKAKNGKSAYDVAMKDYLKAPVVNSIDKSAYTGHVGDQIVVRATDDFLVKNVRMLIHDPGGVLIEQGMCVAQASGNNWNYSASVAVATLTGVVITAVAVDNPGNTGQLAVTLT